MEKRCSKCNTWKDFFSFHKNKSATDGYNTYCKDCMREYSRKWKKSNRNKANRYRKKWADRNKDKIREYHKKQYEKNKQQVMKKVKEWQKNNPEKVSSYKKRYEERNAELLREKARDTQKNKRKTARGKLDINLSRAIHKAINAQKAGRAWESLVGYSVDDLMQHLESQFDENMSGDNYGSYWHIDHVIPKCYFQYETPEDSGFMQCWALENLQPMEANQNFQKNSRILWQA